jgi:hypothetical protein
MLRTRRPNTKRRQDNSALIYGVCVIASGGTPWGVPGRVERSWRSNLTGVATREASAAGAMPSEHLCVGLPSQRAW